MAAYAQVLNVASEWLITGEGPRERVHAERTVELDGEIDPRLAMVAAAMGDVPPQVLRSAQALRGGRGTADMTDEGIRNFLASLLSAERAAAQDAELQALRRESGRAPISKVGGGNEVEDDDELARKRKAALRKR